MFAMDRAWWEKYKDEVSRDFVGVRYSSNPIPANWGVTRLDPAKFSSYGNSGAACVSLAVKMGAERVVMLGFDCQHTGGKTHWHGSHPRGLGDAGSINKWPAKFNELRAKTVGVDIVNATRETALDMFPRVDLESALALTC